MLTDADLLGLPLPELTALARIVRDGAHGRRVTFSPKVFIPLTMLCRDRCGYCTFAKAPARLSSPYLTAEEVLSVAAAGPRPGCHEALFTLGERPELRYPVAASWLARHGYASTVEYLVEMCQLVVTETGLLPHANAGALYADELAALRPVTASQGMMLESLAEGLAAHRGAPDKEPSRRLATLEAAGELRSRSRRGSSSGSATPGRPAGGAAGDRGVARAARARPRGHRAELPAEAGDRHVQGCAVPARRPVWAIAAARLVLPPSVHVQAPPNLSDDLTPLLDAGIDDWGGVSPVTADHVNPERAWPALDVLRAATESGGHTLAPRLTVYPSFALAPARWLAEEMRFPVLDASDAEGLARDDVWYSGGEEAPPALLDGPVGVVGVGEGVGVAARAGSAAAPWPRSWPASRWARRSASPRS